jgi:hypothetical protein
MTALIIIAQSPAKPSVPNAEWRRDALPFDKRPMRQFVWLSGERFHSGLRWRRDHWGLAYIRPDGLGYRDEDIAQLELEGDMDAGTGEVYGWLPACKPAYFDMEVREPCVVNASCDTHPKGGDVQQAPLVSGAVAKPDAQRRDND